MILQGDCIEVMKKMDPESVHCCVTSPPYWGLRDYGVAGQIGLEETMDEFISKMVQVFREVRRILRNDGTLWLNLGDTYSSSHSGSYEPSDKQASNLGSLKAKEHRANRTSGLKPKDLCGIPWRVALALQADGWYLRSDIIWHKPAPMPESIADRCTKSHEYIFLFAKSQRYYYDAEAIKEPVVFEKTDAWTGGWATEGEHTPAAHATAKRHPKMRPSAEKGSFNGKHGDEAFRAVREFRNKRTVWTVSSPPFPEAHFATFPPKLIEPCVLAGSPRGGKVLDPFFGAGTTGLVALRNAREFVGIELNPEYIKIAEKRLKCEDTTPTMFDLSSGL